MLNNTVFAQNSIITAPVQATKAIFQTNLETEINNAIVQIQGDVYAEEIQKRVMEIAQKAISERPEELKKEDLSNFQQISCPSALTLALNQSHTRCSMMPLPLT